MLRQRSDRLKTQWDTVPPFSAASRSSRAAACIAAFALILAGVFYATSSQTEPTLEPLFGGRVLRELELDQVELAFSKAGLSGWSRVEGRMLVPGSGRHEYLAALESAAALPFALRSHVHDTITGGSYLESESARKIRLQSAKSRDLGNKIAAFDDIAWASVDYDEQSLGGFDRRMLQSASVLLVSKSGKPVSPGRISMIQNLIAAAYAGMEPDQVTVTDTSARKTYSGSDDPLTRQQRQVEYELEQRLTELLSGYRGLHIAARSVCIEREPASSPVDGSPIAISKSIAKDSATNEFEMHVSVGVPESLFHSQWVTEYRSRHPQASVVESPDETQLSEIRDRVMENILDAVTPLISANRKSNDHPVRVWSFPDFERTPIYAAPSVHVVGWAPLVDWLQANPAIAIPIGSLLVIAIVVWASTTWMRLRQHDSQYGQVVQPSRSVDIQSSSNRDSSPRSDAEASLRDDLAELVDSNPELAAQIVHSWIADAA